jgi:hypothetical protein
MIGHACLGSDWFTDGSLMHECFSGCHCSVRRTNIVEWMVRMWLEVPDSSSFDYKAIVERKDLQLLTFRPVLQLSTFPIAKWFPNVQVNHKEHSNRTHSLL